jgi:hypothetical protein
MSTKVTAIEGKTPDAVAEELLRDFDIYNPKALRQLRKSINHRMDEMIKEGEVEMRKQRAYDRIGNAQNMPIEQLESLAGFLEKLQAYDGGPLDFEKFYMLMLAKPNDKASAQDGQN